MLDQLEPRQLMSTIQNFDTPGTSYTFQQLLTPPAPFIQSGGPTGNYLTLSTQPQTGSTSNANSISFVTSDPGSYSNATASWDFRLVPSGVNFPGVGMSFGLLNTAVYGPLGGSTTVNPEQGLYTSSLGIGFQTFDATNQVPVNRVTLSFNNLVVATQNLSRFYMGNGDFIHAQLSVDFSNALVSLILTDAGVTETVFNSVTVANLVPYRSRVAFEARTLSTSYANFDLDNISVDYTGIHDPGSFSFASSSYSVAENAGVAYVDIVRKPGGPDTVQVSVVTIDDTAQSGVNYTSVAQTLTFSPTQLVQTLAIPIIDDRLQNSDKTVLLSLSNLSNTATFSSPVKATLTIRNTDATAPTVKPRATLVRIQGSGALRGFRLTFSRPMDRTRAENLANYQVTLPPLRKNGPRRVVALSRAVLDTSGLFVTLYRANLGVHLGKTLQILVRGITPDGLTDTNGTFLAGDASGKSGTNAIVTV